MKLTLDAESQKLIEDRIKAGDYSTPEDVVRAALVALKQQEEWGDFAPGELERLLAEGEESIEREGTVSADEVFADLQRRSDERRASAAAGRTEREAG
jgi:putative addiction module CopG family antidote